MKRYTYTLIRYVHDPVAEEFANVGLVMFVPDTGEFLYRVDLTYGRLSQFFDDFAPKSYGAAIRAIDSRLHDVLDAQSRPGLDFDIDYWDQLQRAISPDGGAGIVLSDERIGRHREPAERFERLCAQFLHQAPTKRAQSQKRPRAAKVVEAEFRKRVQKAHLESYVSYEYTLEVSPLRSHQFTAGWQNGVVHVADILSMDLQKPQDIIDRAYRFGGLLVDLAKENEFVAHPLLVPPTHEDCRPTYHAAREVLGENEFVSGVFEPRTVPSLIDQLVRDAREHGA